MKLHFSLLCLWFSCLVISLTACNSGKPANIPFEQVSAGSGFVCALTTGGTVECWGDNSFGQTDVPEEFIQQKVPVK